MKKTAFFVFLSAVILASSCKKDDKHDSTPDPSASLVKEMAFYDSLGTFVASQSFEYDNLGRVILARLYYPGHSGTSETRYGYYSGRAIEYRYDTNQIMGQKYIYQLDGNGLATSKTSVGYNGSDSTVILTDTYTYNQDGFMTEDFFFPGDSIFWNKTIYSISGNNVVSIQYEGIFGQSDPYPSTYYSGTVNTLGNTNLGMTWMGKSSQELVKTFTVSSGPEDNYMCTYTFDTQNRVATKKITGVPPATGNTEIRVTYY